MYHVGMTGYVIHFLNCYIYSFSCQLIQNIESLHETEQLVNAV
jgi:hypothetical protein